MNNATVSMTSLLDFIHSMSLSASNKKWLADRLYEETKSETVDKKEKEDWPKLSKEDLVLSPEVMKLVEDITPLPEDFDYDKARLEYYSATSEKADCIITRNKKDFATSDIDIYEPTEFLQILTAK